MNGEFQDKNIFKSMKINSLTNNQNNFNDLQFISMDFENNKIINNFEGIKSENQNNGLPINNLNISENELFNYELDQSTESIMTNQSLSRQIPFEYSSKNKNINNHINNNENNNISSALLNENNFKFKNNSDEIKFTFEEKLKQEYLKNQELKNYIEILKQTINNALIQNKDMGIEGLDNASQQLKKSKIDILTEYTAYKLENEKIKKQLVMQQILYTDMKNEISNLKQENNKLKTTLEKTSKENKNLSKIKEEITSNYNILLSESDEIKNTLLKYEEEFTNCQKNNSDYIRLKSENFELNNNFEKQKNILLNLQNDFNKINQTNNELNKYNEKLVKENQQLKRELFHKKNELENVNNKINTNFSDIRENNDLFIKEKDDLVTNMKNIEEENNKLSEIKDNQKIEIESLNNIIKNKNEEILKYLKEIEYLKNSNNNNICNMIKTNKGKTSSDINMDLIISNIQNELNEKNKLIEDLKVQNIELIKDNEYKENTINEYIIKENSNKKELVNINNEDKKYREQIDKLNTFIKQKELEIYSFKNNEKSYNKIIDLSYQSIKQFISKLKNYEDFKEEDEIYINLDLNNKNNIDNNLFIRPLKEFANKISEENNNNTNNYYNGNNFPLIEKIKKINIFTNIIPFEINVLYNKIKSLQQENKVLLNIKGKNNNIINKNNEDINMDNISQNNKSTIEMNKDNKIDIFENLKKYNTSKNNIQNIKTINSNRNNILDFNNNQSSNINMNLKNMFDDNKNSYRNDSNSQNKKTNYDKETNNNQKLDKINLKVKEINNYIFNNQTSKTIFDEEIINYNDNIKTNNKTNKKSKITLFKEEISNKSFINNNKDKGNKNIFLSIQTSPENKGRNNIVNKKNSNININNNITNLSQLIFKNNTTNINNNVNNINYMNKNISQPVTKRTKNQKNDSIHNRNSKKLLDELNLSYTYKNILNSNTIDSTRINNNISPLLNDNSFLNKNRKTEDKNNKKNNELYQKSINGLADEVMKPSFLKSDVSMTILGNNYNNNGNNSNNTSSDSFLFSTKNKQKKKNKQNESYSFVEIQNNVKRNVSPFNKDRNNNNSNLNRNRSFLY